MADTYDEAGSQIDQQKAAQLAAMAQYGSQGQSAFIQAQNDVRSQREMAINAAIADAARRGAPQAIQDQLRSQIGQPYDRRLSDMTSAAGMAGYDQARRLADIEGYFGQVKASIPALRSIGQSKLADLQAKAAKDAYNSQLDDRKQSLAERRLALDEADFAKNGGKTTAPRFSSSLVTAAKTKAYGLQQAAVLDDLRNHFGQNSRTEAELMKLIGTAKSPADALNILRNGLKDPKDKSGKRYIIDPRNYWFGSGKRPRTADGHLALDARVLARYIQDYGSDPSDDYLAKAREAVLQEGNY
jgi:hypothetical protein